MKNDLEFIKVTNDNFEIAFNIQKSIWPSNLDYDNFVNKAKSSSEDNISYIVYYNNDPIGITGVYIEDIDKESIWLDWYGVLPKYRNKGFGKRILLKTIEYCKKLDRFEYLRLDTTFWKGRPAIFLYDKIMHFKEQYNIEGHENCLIYTYSLKGNMKLWNNRYLGLNDYYKTNND